MSNVQSYIHILIAEISRVKLTLDESQWTVLITSQHWIRYWLGAFRQDAITWTSLTKSFDTIRSQWVTSLQSSISHKWVIFYRPIFWHLQFWFVFGFVPTLSVSKQVNARSSITLFYIINWLYKWIKLNWISYSRTVLWFVPYLKMNLVWIQTNENRMAQDSNNPETEVKCYQIFFYAAAFYGARIRLWTDVCKILVYPIT